MFTNRTTASLTMAMGVESGILMSHVLSSHQQHVCILEVPHGVLYPGPMVHVIEFQEHVKMPEFTQEMRVPRVPTLR